MEPNLDLDLSGGMLAVVGVLAAVQLTLIIIGLVDLVRRPRERVVFDNKWIWAAIIVLISMIGAIIYLAVGRRPAPVTVDEPTDLGGRSASSVADSLYGQPEAPADHGGQPDSAAPPPPNSDGQPK